MQATALRPVRRPSTVPARQVLRQCREEDVPVGAGLAGDGDEGVDAEQRLDALDCEDGLGEGVAGRRLGVAARRRLGRSERPLLLETASVWEPRIRFARNVPRLWMFPIRAMYLEAINRASHNVWMTQAYFLPDEDFVDAVKAAARRGVDVRLLLPLKSNHIVADWISRGFFSQLLDSGVRILRYRDAMVHAKTATVDGTWSTVGTANIDRLSLTGNYEINLEILDDDLAQVGLPPELGPAGDMDEPRVPGGRSGEGPLVEQPPEQVLDHLRGRLRHPVTERAARVAQRLGGRGQGHHEGEHPPAHQHPGD